MGKIRIKTIGLEDIEKKQKADAKKRRDIKKAAKQDKVKAPQGKGGERMKQVGVSEDDLVKQRNAEELIKAKVRIKEKKDKAAKSKKEKKAGKKYKKSLRLIKSDKKYSIEEAVEILKKIKYASFDETVEVHISVLKTGIKGDVSLPHGTGKQRKVAIVDEKILGDIEKGRTDFDVLIAAPDMMPKLVKYAKVLGPKGLMPNPKRGTVTDKPKEALKKFSDGAVSYKTEPKFPLIHQTVGKISFKEKNLIENISTLIQAIGASRIKKAYLSTTMSPSIRLKIE